MEKILSFFQKKDKKNEKKEKIIPEGAQKRMEGIMKAMLKESESCSSDEREVSIAIYAKKELLPLNMNIL